MANQSSENARLKGGLYRIMYIVSLVNRQFLLGDPWSQGFTRFLPLITIAIGFSTPIHRRLSSSVRTYASATEANYKSAVTWIRIDWTLHGGRGLWRPMKFGK